jgi:hypothetical protein
MIRKIQFFAHLVISLNLALAGLRLGLKNRQVGEFLVSLIFMWAGFVRTGLGFGGAALGLPLMLLVGASPVYWLPPVSEVPAT